MGWENGGHGLLLGTQELSGNLVDTISLSLSLSLSVFVSLSLPLALSKILSSSQIKKALLSSFYIGEARFQKVHVTLPKATH